MSEIKDFFHEFSKVKFLGINLTEKLSYQDRDLDSNGENGNGKKEDI